MVGARRCFKQRCESGVGPIIRNTLSAPHAKARGGPMPRVHRLETLNQAERPTAQRAWDWCSSILPRIPWPHHNAAISTPLRCTEFKQPTRGQAVADGGMLDHAIGA
jgi:hypothetical protein